MQSRTSTQDMLPKLDLHGGRGAPDKDSCALALVLLAAYLTVQTNVLDMVKYDMSVRAHVGLIEGQCQRGAKKTGYV